jgi:hypothetical protein
MATIYIVWACGCGNEVEVSDGYAPASCSECGEEMHETASYGYAVDEGDK